MNEKIHLLQFRKYKGGQGQTCAAAFIASHWGHQASTLVVTDSDDTAAALGVMATHLDEAEEVAEGITLYHSSSSPTFASVHSLAVSMGSTRVVVDMSQPFDLGLHGSVGYWEPTDNNPAMVGLSLTVVQPDYLSLKAVSKRKSAPSDVLTFDMTDRVLTPRDVQAVTSAERLHLGTWSSDTSRLLDAGMLRARHGSGVLDEWNALSDTLTQQLDAMTKQAAQ